jgi:hypothetical protein
LELNLREEFHKGLHSGRLQLWLQILDKGGIDLQWQMLELITIWQIITAIKSFIVLGPRPPKMPFSMELQVLYTNAGK